MEFAGTILLVSHDRAFIDHVATSTWLFDGRGGVHEYVGGYSDLPPSSSAPPSGATPARAAPQAPPPEAARATPPATNRRKRSYKEQREIDEMPARIEVLEREQAALQVAVADPGLYEKDQLEVTRLFERLATIDQALAECYARWEGLESS